MESPNSAVAGRRRQWPGAVLVIDDESLIRESTVALLRHVGADCLAVATADEALALLETEDRIKFVIHDYYLPETDPAVSIERIRATRHDVTLIGTSGTCNRDEFAAMGVHRFLPKPWRLGELLRQLSDAEEDAPIAERPGRRAMAISGICP